MRLSVIVPVYNARAFLERCLAALRASTFQDYECVAVDDASTDDLSDLAERYGVRMVRLERNGGPARARNRGAQEARGEILVFIDSDVCVHPDTLSRIDAHFRDHPQTAAVMGSYDDTPDDIGFISQYKNLFHHFVHQQSRTQAWTFWAGCGAMRRAVFLEAGGFDEAYGRPCIEDIELGNRLYASGQRIDLNPTIQVTHLKRWTLWGLVRTDIRDRGVPWFLLMMRNRDMPADLNVTHVQRLCVGLIGLLLALVALGGAAWLHGSPRSVPVGRGAALGIAAVSVALIYLNRDFYRFFARKRGWLFALGTVPLHWLYYLYCGISVMLAFVALLWERMTRRQLVPVPHAKPKSGTEALGPAPDA
jgi:glycosyltransferase involved in cell wall biosynthesis